MLTQKRLKEILYYNPETGIFTWLIQAANRIKPNTIAGWIEVQGYVCIMIANKTYKVHRLAWLYMTGEWPKHTIDHINAIRRDNRFTNLREATTKENCQNRTKANRTNGTGLLGAHYHKQAKKYRAAITIDGKHFSLGLHETPELAHAAYLKKKREIHPMCTI